MLVVRDVEAGYGRTRTLIGVSLRVDAGELVTIVGPNGSGKTTLLRTITGLVPARAGSITFDGRRIEKLRTEDIVGRGIVMVPEGRELFGALTVRENLILGAYARCGLGRAERAAKVERVLALFPALRARLGRAAATLSGGEQQMVAIGRALMAQPRLLLLDEPSVGLAPLVVREIFRALAGLKSRGLTILLVEQNARAAFRIADRGYALQPGGVIGALDGDDAAGTRGAYGLELIATKPSMKVSKPAPVRASEMPVGVSETPVRASETPVETAP
jgi:branched-chain amino acid transport system ATP-binding protein